MASNWGIVVFPVQKRNTFPLVRKEKRRNDAWKEKRSDAENSKIRKVGEEEEDIQVVPQKQIGNG